MKSAKKAEPKEFEERFRYAATSHGLGQKITWKSGLPTVKPPQLDIASVCKVGDRTAVLGNEQLYEYFIYEVYRNNYRVQARKRKPECQEGECC